MIVFTFSVHHEYNRIYGTYTVIIHSNKKPQLQVQKLGYRFNNLRVAIETESCIKIDNQN